MADVWQNAKPWEETTDACRLESQMCDLPGSRF